MKITREEFKEFVALYHYRWESFEKLADTFNDNFLDEILFQETNWLAKKLGLEDILLDFITGDNFYKEDGSLISTVDEFYDEFVDSKYKED